MATADLIDATGLGGVRRVNKSRDQRNHPIRLEVLQDIRGHDGSGHTACSNRSNNVGEDVILGTLLSQGLGETDLAELGGGVVCLAEAAEETGGGGGVDHTAILLFAEVRPSGLGALWEEVC